jgi:hypothetical protein
MQIDLTPVQLTLTIHLTLDEAEMLRDRAQLAHEKFEGGGTGYLNVMQELAEALRHALKKGGA